MYDVESLIHSLIHSLKIQTYSFPFIHELTFFHLQHLFVVSFTCCRSICHVNLSFLGLPKGQPMAISKVLCGSQTIYLLYIHICTVYIYNFIYIYVHQIPDKMLGKMWCNTKIACKLSEHVTQKMNTCQIECHIKCENWSDGMSHYCKCQSSLYVKLKANAR